MIARYARWLFEQFGRSWARSMSGIVLLNFGGVGLFIFFCNWWVSRAGGFPLFDSVEQIPANEVALVLGTAPVLAGGLPNRYFVSRMNAAAALFNAGKARILLLSGNCRDDGYDEPAAMREALTERGVPNELLLEDRAGIRTLDSVVRAKLVFRLDRLTVVSQEFHNRRALFFCKHFQIDGVALNADPAVRRHSWRLTCREFAARAVAVLNVCGRSIQSRSRESDVEGIVKVTARV
jgi:SanA protein